MMPTLEEVFWIGLASHERPHSTSRHSIGYSYGDWGKFMEGLGMGDVMDDGERLRQAEADAFAKKNGGQRAYFISDAWGGYWQTVTINGPYNFRLTPPAFQPKPAPPDTPSS